MEHDVYKLTFDNHQAIIAAKTYNDAFEQFDAIYFQSMNKRIPRYAQIVVVLMLRASDV